VIGASERSERESVIGASERSERESVIAIPSTQPLRRGRWVFAHDGRIEDHAFLRERTSPSRRRECAGETDGEQLFAFLLSALDTNGLADGSATERTDAAVAAAVDAAIGSAIGSLTFVLSDGETLYASRCGRSLSVLHRAATRGAPAAFLVASQPITAEAWLAVEDRALVRCARPGALDLRWVRGRDPRPLSPSSEVELPFTD
jgi:predicted glutamine amidotransferase